MIIELSQLHIEYVARTMVKAQSLSNFVAECQFSSPSSTLETLGVFHRWLITNLSGGAGIILISPEGFKIQQALKFSFPVTNNGAEYKALIGGIRLVIELEVKVLDIFETPN